MDTLRDIYLHPYSKEYFFDNLHKWGTSVMLIHNCPLEHLGKKGSAVQLLQMFIRKLELNPAIGLYFITNKQV